jgi:capsular polysaccharide biosynthesis protein
MKRVLKGLISLYPTAWRDRYSREFDALLDDVSPTWRTLFDVFGGAFKMQIKIWTPWKIIAGFAVAGVIATTTYWWMAPKRYVSTAVIKVGDDSSDEKLNALAQRIMSRDSLFRIINEEGLYEGARARLPSEDVIERMKTQDIMIRIGERGAVMVEVAAPDAGQAQRATRNLAARFVNAKAGSLLDPASFPAAPWSPRRSRIIIVGLVAGVLAGVLFALFNGLKVWKLAAALGIAGLALGAAIAFSLPDRYSSVAVLRYDAPDGSGMQQLIAAVTSDASLDSIVQRFGLYPNDPEARRKLREHLYFRLVQKLNWKSGAIAVQFNYHDKFLAQKVTQDVVSSLIDAAVRTRTDVKVIELLDPASLAQRPTFPDRPMFASTGLFLGLGCAVAWGVWRYYKRPLPLVAAR